MKGLLIIYILSTSSSYIENVEQSSKEYFDVLEWWITEDKSFRIKTFSLDTDIHIYEIQNNDLESGIDLARQNSEKNYGDIIVRSVEIELKGTESQAELNQILIDLNLKGGLESSEFIFWNPDGRNYETKSNPE